MTEAKLEITADPAGLEAGVKKAKEAMAEGMEAMKGSIESLNGAFERMNGAFVAFTAVLAGGAAFKEAVEASISAATGAKALGRELGITATQASILKVAMDENFVPMEAVSGAANKIAAAIKKNPAEFDRLGVAIRDSNGNMRNSFEIMQDVNAKLAAMQEGTARNVEGQRIYGKAWESIAPSIRITESAMEEAKEKATALHLIVGKEGMAQATAYRNAMASVHTVFDAIYKAIGDALIPALTALGEWFASIGPQCVEALKASIISLYSVFETLISIGATVAEAIKGYFEEIGRVVLLVMNTVTALVTKGPTGAKEAWDEGLKEIEEAAKRRVANIANIWKQGQENIDAFAAKQTKQDTPVTEVTPGKNTIEDDNAGKSRVEQWQTELEAFKANLEQQEAAEGQIRELSKQEEIAYWQQILVTTKTSQEERKAIAAKIAADQLAISRAQLDGQLALLKDDEAAQGNNLAARLAAEQKYAEAVRRIYGAQSTQYAAAQKEITATLQAQVKQRSEIAMIEAQGQRTAALQEIDSAEETAKKKHELMQISLAQLIALEKDYEAQRYAIKQQELAQELALEAQGPDDPVKKAQLLRKTLETTQQYNQQLLKIDQQATQQQVALQKQVTDMMTSGFSTAFAGVLKGTMTVQKAMQSFFQSIIEGVIDMFAKWVAQQVTATVVSLALNRQQQASQAATAATGAGASAASIPYIGWIIAIGAMAAVFAAASGYKAEGGFDVPAGMNPVTQLHQKEMVLPAKLAEPIRQNIENGGNGFGGGSDLHMHINAIDPHSFQRALKRNDSLVKALRDLHRRAAYRR